MFQAKLKNSPVDPWAGGIAFGLCAIPKGIAGRLARRGNNAQFQLARWEDRCNRTSG